MQDILLFTQHHYWLLLALSAVLILLIVLEFFKQKNASHGLSPLKATHLINHDNAVVIDVRSTDAFAKGHIVNAISLPASDIQQKTGKLEKHKSNPLILVCATGTDSTRIANQLLQQGYTTHFLSGGLRTWTDANLPLVKG